MPSGKTIAGLLVAVTIAATLFVPINSAVMDNSGEVDISEETATADIGNAVGLDGYNILEGSETVEYYDSGNDSWTTATSGTDYEIDTDQGTITALEGGAISDGDELRVSYTYEATNSTTTTVMQLLPMFLGLLILVSIATPIMDSM